MNERTTTDQIAGRRAGALLALTAAAGSILLAACHPGMDAIDRRLARVIGESATQASIRDEPRIEPARPVPDKSADLYDTDPATLNPNAETLEFDELDRGVPGSAAVITGLNDRLRRYASAAGGVGRDDVLLISLTDSLLLSQREGREYMDAEEEYIISAIGLLIERHRWGPRLFADSSISASGDGDDGRFDNALNVVNTLRATQRLPYGGDVEARWVWNATEDLRSSVTGQYQQSSSLVLDANIPLLRGSGMVARESRIQAERDLIYAARDFETFRRTYFVSVAQDYFRLLQAVSGLQNQIARLRSLELFVRQEEALYDAGRRSAFNVNQARNQFLEAQSSLASSREQYTLQVDRFKVRLGLPAEIPVRLVGASIDVSEPATTVDAASASALSYRLDIQNRRDQLEDARRGVLVARDQLRADLDFNGNVRIPTDPDVREGGLAIDPDETSWEAGILLSLPIDRRIERLQLRQSLIRLEQQRRGLDEFTDNVVIDARRRVREIDLSRFRLELAERQVEINERRLEEQRLKADLIDTRDRLDAERDLLNAKNDRDQALTDLRIAILNYLDSTGQLRVGPEGLIEPIPGMRVDIEDQPIDFDALFVDEVDDPSLYEPLTPPVLEEGAGEAEDPGA